MGNRKYREERKRERRGREEEELAAALLLRRKRLIAIGGGLVVAGLILFAVVRWMLQPLPTDVHGRLADVREMSFVEGVQRGGGISPVCGCKEPELDSWRGVEFAGRKVSLRLRGGPWAQWLISSAEPTSISLTGEKEIMRATAYRLPAEGFDPLAFARAHSEHSGHLVSSAGIRSPKFSFLTRGELKVALPGPIPIGAWIPFPKSHVKLTATRSPFPQEPQRPHLIEHYPPQVGYWPDPSNTPHPKERQIYPLGDFLGPDLVLWTDDPEARIVGTPFGKAAGPGTVTAVVVASTIFSTRVAVTPAGEAFVTEPEIYPLDPKELGERGFDSSGISGTLSLTVDQPLARKDYERVQGLVTENPKEWVLADINPEFGGRPGVEYDVLQEQRFPPLPDHAGFNVFGPLERVMFRNVSGDLTVGDSHVDLGGGADLDVNEVEVFRNSHDEQLISSPLATSEESAELDFGARGMVSVNGVAQRTVESEYVAPMRVLAVILTLLGSVFGVFNALKGRRERA